MGYTRPRDGELGASRATNIKRVLWIVLFLNVAVALAKLTWGTISNSAAMQADGFHSLFDGTSNIVGLVGMGFAGRPADRDHPYGHYKYETYASAVIGAMLLFAAYRIGGTAIANLRTGGAETVVDATSFVVMIGTLCVNIFVTLWERRAGEKYGSEILVADASHTASDALVSIGVIIGLIFVKLGYPMADGITALLVAGAIVYTAAGVFKQASATLSDSARIDVDEICTVVLACPGVLGCHHIRTRGSEAEVYVDLHVQVDETRTVADGHRIAEEVEQAIAANFPQVVDVIAHLEPFDEYQAGKTAEERDAGLG